MLLNLDMADAFVDWLDLTRLQRALITARPGLDGAVILDELRPLLRARRPAGAALLVARTAQEDADRWLVGIPRRPDPVLHQAGTTDEMAQIVLAALEDPRFALAEARPVNAGADPSASRS